MSDIPNVYFIAVGIAVVFFLIEAWAGAYVLAKWMLPQLKKLKDKRSERGAQNIEMKTVEFSSDAFLIRGELDKWRI